MAGLLDSLLQAIGVGNGTNSSTYNGKERARRYLRNRRLYDGYSVRNSFMNTQQYKKLKYNMAHAVANVGADFLANQEISFWVAGNDVATKKCAEIWKASGGGSSFLQHALLAAQQGDAIILVEKSLTDKVARFRWVDPVIAEPVFDPHDSDKIQTIHFSYLTPKDGGGTEQFRETWNKGSVTQEKEGKTVSVQTYDEEMFGGMPVHWIRNMRVGNDMFGRADVDPITELTEEYDHLCSKQTKVHDYYSSPNLYVKGVPKGRLDITKGDKTVYHLPENGEIGFIEWKGTQQSAENHIQRVKTTIAEMSETPEVSFSRLETGMTHVSGVALKMLYAPLINKTNRKRMCWSPPMIRAMKDALLVEGITVDVHDIGILWQSPVPSSDLDDWTISGLKDSLGVTKKQILKERGYTDWQIEQMTKEKEKEIKKANELEPKPDPASSAPPGQPKKPSPNKKNIV